MGRPLYTEVLYGTISDASSSGVAGSVNLPVHHAGFIVKNLASANSSNGSGAVALTMNINGSTTDLTSATMTIASSGARGAVVSATPSGLRDVVEDDFIQVLSDGNSTIANLAVNVAVLMRR